MILSKDCSRDNLTSWGLAFIVLLQNPPWFLFNYGLVIGYLLAFVLFCYASILNRDRFLLQGLGLSRLPILYISILCLLVIPLLYGLKISTIFIFITYVLLFKLKISDLKRSLDIITNIVAIIILLSLPLWLFHVFIFELPSFGTLDISEMKGSHYVFDNHFLFLIYNGFDYFRFYSVFDEPGVLGTLSAFILFGNKYDMRKWQNIVIFLGGVFTYSLAFYILFLIGYFYFASSSLCKLLKSLLALILISSIVFFLLKDDVSFTLSIIERLQNFGLESIDNRTGDEINEHLDAMYKSPVIVFGEGPYFLKQHSDTVGASYKLFIIEYGLMGLLSLFLMYFSLVRIRTKDTIFCLILFVLSFFQRPYAFTSWQLVLFAAIQAKFYIGRFYICR